MKILDSRSEIAAIDKDNVLGSVEQFSKQCGDAWTKTRDIQVPEEYRRIDNIVLCGMGGSGLGARIIESVYTKELLIPLVRVNGYDLPGFVNEQTLVSCSSYSGSTEETLENAKQAIAKKAKWMAIGTGGTLLELAKEYNVPFYRIEPTYNPSNQPRMAVGYSVIGQLALVAHAGAISITKEEIDDIVPIMSAVVENNKVEIPQARNTAKSLALNMKEKVVVFVSAEHLVGAMHTINNQQNENAKNTCFDVQVPELNHHLMEGLKHPLSNKKNMLVVFAQSSLYSPQVQTRMRITEQVVKKNGINTIALPMRSKTKLSQSFELIQLGAYANFYLSMVYKQNPAPIPWVDWFKEEMKKENG